MGTNQSLCAVTPHNDQDGSPESGATVPSAKSLGTGISVQSARSHASAALRSALKAHDITQEGFARRIGVSRALVRNWCDERHDATFGDAYKVLAQQAGLSAVVASYRAALDVRMPHVEIVQRNRLRQLMREAGDVAEAEEEAEADGVVDRREHLVLAKEWGDIARVAQEAHVFHLTKAIPVDKFPGKCLFASAPIKPPPKPEEGADDDVREQDVIDVMTEEPMRLADIIDGMGDVDKEAVRRILRRLVGEDRVVKEGAGAGTTYKLAEGEA